MAGVTVSVRAREDFLHIWSYVANEDVRAADRLLDRIDAQCQTLAEHPRMGPARPDIAAGLRYFRVGVYLILYREAPAAIEIVRVVHGARDLAMLFSDV